MFITNEMDFGELLAEFLQGRRVGLPETATFADYRHDNHLCPGFKKQVKALLDVYQAYGHDVHDIQSMRDDGVDVLIRYEDRDGNTCRAGLQIKSEHEFQEWQKKKLQVPLILKGQYASAKANAAIDDYYVLLCVDAVRHQKRIRTLCSELKNYDVTIVEPEDLLDFFSMSSLELWARATRLLCHNDTVLKRAIEEVEAQSPDVAYFLVSLVCQAFEGVKELRDKELFDLWAEWQSFSDEGSFEEEDRLAGIVGSLTSTGVLDYDDGAYHIDIRELPKAVCALYFDQRVRISEYVSDMQSRLFSLLGMS